MGFSRNFRFGLYGIAVFILAASMYSIAKPALGGTIPAVSEQDHSKGSASAAVTLIEYSDFQCPGCKSFAPIIDDVLTAYGDNVRFIYRHFPLSTIHANAEAAALASEAAAKQGKFWEMHDMLFDRQEDWENLISTQEIFLAYADLLELDTAKFTEDMQASETKDRVRSDINAAKNANISSTPTIYINGEAITFPRNQDPLTYLKERIDAELTSQESVPASE